MKIKICLLIIIVLLFFNTLTPDELSFYSNNNILNFEAFLINNLPGTYFPNFFLENFAPDITLLIEENNGFSLFDNPRVYYEGKSFKDFNWFYNGFKINSALDNGSSAFIIPFSSISSYQLSGDSPLTQGSGLNVSTQFNGNTTSIFLSNVFGNLGSYTPLGPVLIQPEHPIKRDEMLYLTRRKIKNSYIADFSYQKRAGKGLFSLSLSHMYLKRQFNDFRKRDNIYYENLRGVFLSSSYRLSINRGFLEFFTLFNSAERGNLNSELGRLIDETYKKKRGALFFGIRLKRKNLKIDLSYTGEKEDLTSFNDNFSKDILDNDGDGIYPFYNKSGIFNSKVFTGKIDLSIMKKSGFTLNFYSDLRNSTISGNEENRSYNPIYFNKTPYRVFLWKPGKEYTNSNLNLNSGFIVETGLSNNFILTGKFFVNYRFLDFEFNNNDFKYISPGFDFGFKFIKKSTWLSLIYGRYPADMNENVNFFLESNRPYATIYNWSDINSDGIYESGEEKSVVSYSGGKYHFIDKNLKMPHSSRALLLLSQKISPNFSFNIKGLYKRFFNSFRIEFKDVYGFYESDEGKDFYFFNRPFGDFYLTNSKLDKDPFYAELLLNLSAKFQERWFFSFSFMAHIGMGYTAFGNGADSNDIGVLNESMADPNSLINGYGRVDGDRGFVSKFFFGFYLRKNLFFSTSIKYRDGDPFAFLNSYSKYGQRIIYYSTIQAENEMGIKGGPREDYIADLSFKLNYRFRLFGKNSELSLSFFNVIDIGGELSEYVFSGGERYSMEMQLPKSLRINIKIKI